jgi:lysophospholipase L1-like esterase
MRLSPKKRVLFGVVLVAAGCGFALLLSEAFLRLQEPGLHLLQNRYNINLLYAPHPLWDHWPRPGFRIAANLLDRKRYPKPIVFRFNSYGCRDGREPQVPKPAGLRRVLVMGDSFTEGLYEEQTVAATLDRRLNVLPGSARYEVINCGSVSYSPLLHYLRLKHQLLRLEPDVVVLNIDLTDVYDDQSRYRPLYEFSADGEPLRMHGPARWGNRFTSWAVGNLDLALVLYSHRRNFLRATYGPLSRLGLSQSLLGIAPSEAELFAYHSTMLPDAAPWNEGVSFCLDNVRRILELARKHGVRLIITTYPHRDQLTPDKNGRLWNRAFERRLEQFCYTHGAEYYSAFEGIREAVSAGQPVFFENDMHFTPEGQLVWGGLVASYVENRLSGGADPGQSSLRKASVSAIRRQQ